MRHAAYLTLDIWPSCSCQRRSSGRRAHSPFPATSLGCPARTPSASACREGRLRHRSGCRRQTLRHCHQLLTTLQLLNNCRAQTASLTARGCHPAFRRQGRVSAVACTVATKRERSTAAPLQPNLSAPQDAPLTRRRHRRRLRHRRRHRHCRDQSRSLAHAHSLTAESVPRVQTIRSLTTRGTEAIKSARSRTCPPFQLRFATSMLRCLTFTTDNQIVILITLLSIINDTAAVRALAVS